MIWLLLACAEPADSGDSEPCAEPAVGYEGFGEGFLLTHCQGCHASSSPERYGAPVEVSFDDEEQARQWAERIGVTVLELQTMPPGGGVPPDDVALLEQWLSCL